MGFALLLKAVGSRRHRSFQAGTSRPTLSQRDLIHGECLNYFARIKYAPRSMDHMGKSKFLLHLINRSLPGFLDLNFDIFLKRGSLATSVQVQETFTVWGHTHTGGTVYLVTRVFI